MPKLHNVLYFNHATVLLWNLPLKIIRFEINLIWLFLLDQIYFGFPRSVATDSGWRIANVMPTTSCQAWDYHSNCAHVTFFN